MIFNCNSTLFLYFLDWFNSSRCSQKGQRGRLVNSSSNHCGKNKEINKKWRCHWKNLLITKRSDVQMRPATLSCKLTSDLLINVLMDTRWVTKLSTNAIRALFYIFYCYMWCLDQVLSRVCIWTETLK